MCWVKMAGISGKFIPLREEWTYRQLMLRPGYVLLQASEEQRGCTAFV